MVPRYMIDLAQDGSNRFGKYLCTHTHKKPEVLDLSQIVLNE